jgi:preprotein translocase subunit YajC
VVLRISYALLVFVVFGAVAVAIGRSALRDIRRGDGVAVTGGIQALVIAIGTAAIAILAPVLILVRE